MTCPRCGTETSGTFCSTCGASLGGAPCGTCGASLSVGAKFCHVCGRAVAVNGDSGRKGLPAWAPWILVGVLAAVLVVVVSDGRGGRTAAAPAQAPPILRGPDISQMSPRERADALFNRIMAAHERGLADTVAFFTPMAVAAYQLAAPLDRDGHYHVGLIHAVTGDATAARAHADTIAADATGHLFAAIVRLEAAEAIGDTAARQQAARAFLEHYDAEVAAERAEYGDHPGLLEGYRRRLTGGP